MGKRRALWLCFPGLKVTGNFFRRCPLSRKTLLLAFVCGIYLCFVVSQVGYSQLNRNRRIDPDKKQQLSPGLDHPETSSVFPTRSNVVYITLRSKRLKPAHIRGTIRPKLRRKLRRAKQDDASFTHNKRGTLDAGRVNFGREIPDVDYKSLEIIEKRHEDAESDSQVGSIRVYGHRAPPWFSAQDVESMRFLAGAKALRVKEVSHGGNPFLLMFEGETKVPPDNQKQPRRGDVCGGTCGVIRSPVDHSEVFAFHLDRVLGLNRTLPAVSRTFSFLHDGQSCPVVLWDASLYPEGLAAGLASVRLTWREYQSSLKQRCWHKNTLPKPDSGCSAIHHYEWSKLALFDFLLQIHSRLDQGCCGFRPRLQDACVELGHHSDCGKQDRIQLANIVYRGSDHRRLVFVHNRGFFDRNEDNLDFRLLEGIKELPEQAVSVLRTQKLREKLLQSLFLDQTYWESQGGRQGIDKLIDVLERRGKVLLTYINAHGIKVVSMNV